jgi:vacuolar-type H+-ATPase subunit B/Vma2
MITDAAAGATRTNGRAPAPAPERLLAVEHDRVSRVAGPLLVLDDADDLSYGELVEVHTGGGVRRGQVLALDGSHAVVQVLGGTAGIGLRGTSVVSRGRPARTGVGLDCAGRTREDHRRRCRSSGGIRRSSSSSNPASRSQNASRVHRPTHHT